MKHDGEFGLPFEHRAGAAPVSAEMALLTKEQISHDRVCDDSNR